MRTSLMLRWTFPASRRRKSAFLLSDCLTLRLRESRDRVRAAIRNSGFSLPPTHITINLAPADLKKEGSGFDLPIAIGILGAQGALLNRT